MLFRVISEVWRIGVSVTDKEKKVLRIKGEVRVE
jgi:hypothetical protein